MNIKFYLIIGLIIVPLGILFAYRKDYKRNKKDFTTSLKTVFGGILLVIVFLGLKEMSKFFIPVKEHYGFEFNTERQRLGIPKIEDHWIKDKYESEQFATYWWKPDPRNGHFKKVTEFGIIKAKYELDFYQNERLPETFVWSKFDYDNATFQYFLEEPNHRSDSRRRIIKEIDKSEFENYIQAIRDF